MNNPIYQAIVAAKTSLLLTHPEEASILSKLTLVEERIGDIYIDIAGGELLYDPRKIKALTSIELREMLMQVAKVKKRLS